MRKKSTLAFLAAALFLLSGIIQTAVAWRHRPAAFGMAILYVGVATLWVAVGIRFRKKAGQEPNS